MGNKFPDQSLEDIRKMLGLQAEDLSHTRFYHDVFKEGQTELIIRQLGRKLDNLDPSIEKWVKTLSSQQLDLLGEALLNFQDISNL